MNSRPHIWCWRTGLIAAALFLLAAMPSLARDAAFLDPGSSSGGSANASEAIKVEPRNEIDMGDSALNIAKRESLFFTNQTNAPVHIEKIAVNSDSNVTAEISNDDCTKQSTLAPASRCSVEVSITPNSPGTWSVELLVTHNGAGRLTRAKLTGKTGGTVGSEKKDSGLFLSTKEVKPVDFGEIELGQGKSVRSALMVNDSPETITLYSIDVIEADNGLERLDQGCAVDMELKPGESCPVTLVWTPSSEGHISTDLIIRHSGRLGFAVIPIRGMVKGGSAAAEKTTSKDNGKNDNSKMAAGLPPPPSKTELDRLADKIPAVSMGSLGSSSSGLHLIGTVGSRALLYKPDGTTAVADTGEEVDMGDEKVKVISVKAKSAEIMIDGKKKILPLEGVQELKDKAKQTKTDNASKQPSLLNSDSKQTLGVALPPLSSPPNSVSGSTK